MPSKLDTTAGLERTRMPCTAFSEPASPKILDTPAGKQQLALAIIEQGSIKKGANSMGLNHSAVFSRMHTDPELATIVRQARTTLAEPLMEKLGELEELLLSLKGAERTNERISAIREVMHGIRWRIAKCAPATYGDKAGTQINVHNQVAVVCDERTRAQLIALRDKIGAPPIQPQVQELREGVPTDIDADYERQ
jgi:hypothetical protein